MNEKIEISKAGFQEWFEVNQHNQFNDRLWEDMLMEAEKERTNTPPIESKTGDPEDTKTPEFGGTASDRSNVRCIFEDLANRLDDAKDDDDKFRILSAVAIIHGISPVACLVSDQRAVEATESQDATE